MEPIKTMANKQKRTLISEFKYSEYEIYKELCARLDINFGWTTLLRSMYEETTIADLEEIEHQSSYSMRPSDIVLTKLSHKAHTIEEVFLRLYKNRQLVVCETLKPYVNEDHQKVYERGLVRIQRERERQLKFGDHFQDHYSESVPNSQTQIGHDSGIQRMTIKPAGPIQSSPSRQQGYEYSLSTSNNDDSVPLTALVDNDALKVTYVELVEATNNWSQDNKIGSGTFGQVYKGELNFITVAVKRLKDRKPDIKYKELLAEMFLNQYRHEDILPLYRYSIDGEEACLVFQYMKGGNLDERLRPKTPELALSWSQRLRIARGVSRGLAFLHTHDKPLIHGDIKPHNILLNELCEPKIGDFGFATLADDNTPTVSRIRGTVPYMCLDGEMSPSLDVYSFGVVVLEIATGLEAHHTSYTDHHLTTHIYQRTQDGFDFAQLDNNLKQRNPDLCRKFIDLGLECTDYKANRPTMVQVFYNITDMAKEYHPEIL